MKALEDIVVRVLKRWNDAVKESGFDDVYELIVKVRNKEFYINRKNLYEQPIAEMLLVVKGSPTLLLWRKEMRMPKKQQVKGTAYHRIEEDYRRDLYEYFFYECLGNFCNVTKTLITSQDYAEYDIEKDRLKADVSANGMIISTIEGGDWYEKGDEFDVFMVTDTGYFVYTAHDVARRNNGIAKIPKENAMIVEMAKPSIITLDKI